MNHVGWTKNLSACLLGLFSCLLASQSIAGPKLEASESISKLSQQEKLSLAKYYLIHGNIQKAYYLLDQAQHIPFKGGRPNKLARDYYLAFLYFINGQNQKALALLNKGQFQQNVAYRQVCNLKLSIYFTIYGENPSDEHYEQMKKEIESCQGFTFAYAGKEHLWLEGLINLPLLSKADNNFFTQQLDFISTRPHLVSTWLKLGLYTQNPQLVLTNLGKLQLSSYLNSEVRELIALAHYRNHDAKAAFDFIEDLSSVNAENLKGQLLVNEDKLELAYGHFQLALKEKTDSLNALQNLVPLAWILRDTKSLTQFLTQLPPQLYDRGQYYALLSLGQLAQGNVDQAMQSFNLINTYVSKKPRVFTLMSNYALLQSLQDSQTSSAIQKVPFDRVRFVSGLSQACQQGDRMNCWLWEQTLRLGIDQLAQGILAEDKSTPNLTVLKGLLAELSDSQAEAQTGIQEFIKVDQEELEQLDQQDVKSFLIYFDP